MKVLNVSIGLVLAISLIMSQSLLAQPTFQVWSPDYAFTGDWGPDEDTWFVTTSAFELWAIGAYHNESSLEDGHLLVSVPDGQVGSISITGLYGTADPGPGTRYDTTSFFPANFNSHYPLHDDVSDFIVYEIGNFANNLEDIYDYNADNGGGITLTGATGEVKEYWVEVSGFDWVHFDLYGHVIGSSWWEISSCSHDTTFVPAPSAILLGGIGVCLVGWLRRRRTL